MFWIFMVSDRRRNLMKVGQIYSASPTWPSRAQTRRSISEACISASWCVFTSFQGFLSWRDVLVPWRSGTIFSSLDRIWTSERTLAEFWVRTPVRTVPHNFATLSRICPKPEDIADMTVPENVVRVLAIYSHSEYFRVFLEWFIW